MNKATQGRNCSSHILGTRTWILQSTAPNSPAATVGGASYSQGSFPNRGFTCLTPPHRAGQPAGGRLAGTGPWKASQVVEVPPGMENRCEIRVLQEGQGWPWASCSKRSIKGTQPSNLKLPKRNPLWSQLWLISEHLYRTGPLCLQGLVETKNQSRQRLHVS